MLIAPEKSATNKHASTSRKANYDVTSGLKIN